jgi:CheY-like chemotaxis protein
MLLTKRKSWFSKNLVNKEGLENFMNEHRKAILLVDDDRSVLRSFTRILERNGFSVDNAETGKKALQKLMEKKYGWEVSAIGGILQKYGSTKHFDSLLAQA